MSERGFSSGVSSTVDVPWPQRKAQLESWLQQNPLPGITSEEIRAHLDLMPSHYWECVSADDLAWGLRCIHALLEQMIRPEGTATAPVLDWQLSRDAKTARVMLCTWDRHGLLAKTAGTLSALNINILEAEAYTREDNLVLDIFALSRDQGQKPIDDQTCEDVQFLLAGALSEPPRFASVWAYSRHRYLARKAAARPRIFFDCEAERASTVLRIEAKDRLGLLYDVLHSLADMGLEIKRAQIHTESGVAKDQFSFTDASGLKVCAPEGLAKIRQRLESELT